MVCIYYIVPETKGKTLEEIEALWQDGGSGGGGGSGDGSSGGGGGSGGSSSKGAERWHDQ